MGRLIGSGNSDNFGEKFFINKAVEYISEVERKNPYSSFDALAVRKYPVKEYSLHSLPESDLSKNKVQLVDELRSETNLCLRYIRKSRESYPRDIVLL